MTKLAFVAVRGWPSRTVPFYEDRVDSARQHSEEVFMQHFSQEEKVVLSAKTCDRCKRRAEKDDIEFQEFLTIDHRAGYGSVFGDGSQLRLDLCQHCIKAVLGHWLTQREEFDKGIEALNGFVERAGLFTDDEHFGSL